MNDLTGQTIRHFQLTELLGEGGMAVVYKALDTSLERDVAIKLIRIDQFGSAMLDRLLKRFEREAKSLARLSHPNIVKVFEYGEHENAPYLVVEYCPGGDLRQRLRGKPMDWREAIQLILPVARALRSSHQQGVIHRDVKPSNILFSLTGEPMLSDFGIAKILEYDDSATLTGTGVGVGTPGYMAPEQWTGETSTQSDQYGLAVALYEMLAGRKPYEADTPAGILIKQTSQPLPAPRQFAPGIPENVETTLLKALDKDPAKRYPDIGAFIQTLEGLLAGKSEQLAVVVEIPTAVDDEKTIDPTPLPRTVADRPRTPSPPPPAETLIPPPRIHNRVSQVALLGGTAILLALSGFIIWWTNKANPYIIFFITKTPIPTLASTPTAINAPIETPTETATPTISLSSTPSAPFLYVVEDGDNLYSISEKFQLGDIGIPLLFLLNPTVANNNGIVSGGQTIIIPNPGMQLPTETPIPTGLPRGTEVEYIVQSGDTLQAIANKFNSTADDIMARNQLDNANALFVGQTLVIRINLVTPTITPRPN